MISAIAHQYFKDHPDAKDEVMKAFFAYHTHLRGHPEAHNFLTSLRESECQWCGRSREMVRWDDLPPQCAKRPFVPEIKDCIRSEEEKAFALLEKAAKDAPKLVAGMGMSGETLAVLHHTHGYDPETLAGVVRIPDELMKDYHMEMEKQRALSRACHVKEVINVKGL